MLSIIIPTLNEEDCLGFLLKSIKKQDFTDYEIIVADAGSEDKTREIAENYGCQITGGGVPPKSKNQGAKLARKDLILFLDADLILAENSLGKSLEEFEERNLDVAAFILENQNKLHNFSYKFFYNFPALLTEKFLPQALNAILIKKELHQKIGGFDEEIKIGEELDYVRKAAKRRTSKKSPVLGKFGVIKSTKLSASSRRFEEDGLLKTWTKYLLCQFHVLTLGPVKSDIFKYRFNHYTKFRK